MHTLAQQTTQLDWAATALIAAIIWKFATLWKSATVVAFGPRVSDGERKAAIGSIVTQLGVYLLAWGVVAVVAHTPAGNDIFPGWSDPLNSFNALTLLVVAIQYASLASVGYDVKKAIDRSDTAVEPKLPIV